MADLKAIARRFYDEVMTKGKTDVINEIVAPDLVEHEEFPGLPGGREGLHQFVSMMHTAFPDLRATPDDIIVEGNKVVVRSTFTGTHKGDFMGIAPTGKRVEFRAIDVVRFEGDKAVEHWGVTDQMTMMQQLGVVPEGAPAG